MKKFGKLFFVFFALFFIIFLCHLPGYITENTGGYPDEMYFKFWDPLDSFFRKSKILSPIYNEIIYKIPDWTIIPTIVLNGANMVFGFVNFKKKWWFYLLLAISILLSYGLYDYYELATFDDV